MRKKNIRREIEYAKTSDGYNLKIFHYPPENKDYFHIPIILCHGLASNKNSCDFGEPGTKEWEKYSLAAFLSQKKLNGDSIFDVWVPELRGSEQTNIGPQKNPKKYHWCVDDYIDKDIPAIIKCVKQWYQEKKYEDTPVFWVGKSMGGMIAYAYGQTKEGQNNLKGVITIGSPIIFRRSSLFLEFITRITPRNLSIPLRIREIIDKSNEIASHLMTLGVNNKNIEPEILKTYMQIGFNDIISSKVLSQFSMFIKHNTFCRYPQYPWMYDLFRFTPVLKKIFSPYSYTENMHRFITPLLVISGGQDKVAPKTDIIYIKDIVGSKDFTYLEFSKKVGYLFDYGHLDLNLGVNAHEEVYPKIYEWLKVRNKKI
jgi:pimeloyl-ACP methyl ester carboxylesterase